MFLLCDNDILPQLDGSPLSKSVGQMENLRRNCFYFAMIICCCYRSRVLQTNWWTGRERKDTLFLLCDDDLLLLMDLRPSRTFRDRSRTEGKTVSTLGWWTVATDWCASFKQIDGQIKNRRRNCLYFAMMIHCWKHMLLFTYSNW